MSRSIIFTTLMAFSWTTFAHAESPHSIAICNVKQVVDKLGIHDVANAKLKEYEQTLERRLKQLQASYVEKVRQEERKLGDDPAVEQLRRFEELKVKLESQFQRVRDESARDFESHKQRLVANVRGEISKAARKVALENDFSIVLDGSSDLVLAYDTLNVDITHLVIEELKERVEEADVSSEQPPQVQEAKK